MEFDFGSKKLTTSDHPSYRVITDCIQVISSLKDSYGNQFFNSVIPTTQASWEQMLLSSTPSAFLYFGNEMNGWNTSNQFDEIYSTPQLEILFLLNFPNTFEESYPNIQRAQLAVHNLVIQNLRVPTDDLLQGLAWQKNATSGKLLWEFRPTDTGEFSLVVTHNFNVRDEWIDKGRTINPNYHLSSIRIPAFVCNVNAE